MGLTISVDWEHRHCFGYALCVWNGSFTASTDLNVGPEEVSKFAGFIAG